MSETTMDSSTLAKTLGMECLGFTLATWLFGINTAQAYTYFQKYNDRLALKLTVIATVILDLANTVSMCWGLYLQVASNFGEPLGPNIPLLILPIFMALGAFIVECFFAQTIYRISGRNKALTIVILMLATAHLALAVTACVQGFLSMTFSLSSTFRLVISALSIGFTTLTDVVITTCLVIFFFRGRSSIGQASSVLDRLIGYTIQRGLVITVSQILLTVFLFAMPDNFAYTIFLFVQGKLYTLTFLAILNRRDRLRQMAITHAEEVQYMPHLLASSVNIVGSVHEEAIRHEATDTT